MSWVSVDAVAEAIGGSATDPFLVRCTDAANAWAYRRRKQAGYTDDSNQSPGPDADLGVITYATVLFRERGAVDAYASFDEFATGTVPSSSITQCLRLLGIPRPMVDRLDSDRDMAWRYRHGYTGIP